MKQVKFICCVSGCLAGTVCRIVWQGKVNSVLWYAKMSHSFIIQLLFRAALMPLNNGTIAFFRKQLLTLLVIIFSDETGFIWSFTRCKTTNVEGYMPGITTWFCLIFKPNDDSGTVDLKDLSKALYRYIYGIYLLVYTIVIILSIIPIIIILSYHYHCPIINDRVYRFSRKMYTITL